MLLYLFCNKSHYENVPFEIPKNWIWCKLDDLAFYKKGPFGSSLTKSMFIPDNGNAYKVYEQKNAIQKDSNLGHYFISSEKFQELKGFEVLPNDIIVSCAGTIGETYIMPSDIRSGIINQALMIIRLHNIDITPFYLLYFDFILKNEAGKDGKGTAIKNIPPFDILKNYWIPLPPLAEQDRIIKEVALWQCLIDSIDGNIEDIFKLSKKIKSKILDLAISGKLVSQDPNDEPAIELLKRINPAFKPCDNSHYENLPQGWTIVGLHSVAEIITGSTPSKLNAEYYNGDVPFYKPNDLDQGRHVRCASEYLSQQGKSISRSIPCNSIAVCCIGSIGKCGFIEKEGVTNQQINTIVPNDAIFPLYMYYFCNSSTFIDELKSLSSAVTISIVNKSKLSTIQIPLPPIAEQKRIISVIEKLYSHLDMITAEL